MGKTISFFYFVILIFINFELLQSIFISAIISLIFIYTQNKKNIDNVRKSDLNIFLKEKSDLDKKKQYIKEIEKNSFAFQNIAHEIRTPLTLIMAPLEDEFRQTNSTNISVALKNSKRLFHLINQLLEIQKATLLERSLILQPINVVYFLSKCAELFITTAEKKGIPFTFTINGKNVKKGDIINKVLILLSEKDSLEKIIFNYLSNALKFCNGKSIELALKEENEKIIISVKDQGDGIPEEKKISNIRVIPTVRK